MKYTVIGALLLAVSSFSYADEEQEAIDALTKLGYYYTESYIRDNYPELVSQIGDKIDSIPFLNEISIGLQVVEIADKREGKFTFEWRF